MLFCLSEQNQTLRSHITGLTLLNGGKSLMHVSDIIHWLEKIMFERLQNLLLKQDCTMHEKICIKPTKIKFNFNYSLEVKVILIYEIHCTF